MRGGGAVLEHPQRGPVSDPGLSEWLALRRVQEGGVAKSAGVYFDHGRPAPGDLTEVFDRLTWTGLVTVAEGDPIWSVRRLSLTDTGHARYAVLCEQRQRVALPVPPAEFGAQTCAETPDVRRSSTAPLAPPASRPDPGVSTGGRHHG